MSSSVPTRAGISKQRTNQSNSKLESKSELDKEKPKAGSSREVIQKNKQRSSSLSKQDQVKSRESPLKSRSIDRSLSKRSTPQNVPIKKSVVDTKKTNVVTKKTAGSSSSNLKKQNAKQTKDIKASSSSSQAIKKTFEKSSRSPLKGPSHKTNVEIAKSFIQNTKKVKTKKQVISNNPKSSSEKAKHSTLIKETDEDPERPRTSTIRKGPPENSDGAESNENELDSHESFPYIEPGVKTFSSKSVEDDDDKGSYEEDFEDYDSDFEESETDSVSGSNSSESSSSSSNEDDNFRDSGIDKNSISGNANFTKSENVQDPEIAKNSVTGNSKFSKSENATGEQKKLPEVKKSREKKFLQMSDRSFLGNKQSSEASVETNIIKPSHSFINFASAVEQEEKKKYSNKVQKRASELREIITLNDATYDHLDIPPMKYDTFIRFFGRSDAKQVFIQTENIEDEEIQTEEIETMNKWTQNPSNDNFGAGGDDVTNSKEVTDSLKNLFSTQDVKLSSFLQNCSKVMLTILNEDYSVPSQVQATHRRNELFYSDGYYTLPPLDFLKNIPVLNIYCCSGNNHYILTIHDGMTKVPQTNDERGIICVWNFLDRRKPEHILIAHSQPTCATFGPAGNNIVIAGMVDGTVVIWDLTDDFQASLDETLSLKAPTYSTAVILATENHHSCIVAIQALFNYSKHGSEATNFARQDDSKNFHVLTLEDMGLLNIWVVVEVLKPDFSGLETDLGLSPGGKLRLVRSSSIFLYDLSALQEIQKINIRTFDFRLIPNDSSRILITTDAGIVLHVNRQGGNANPRFYSSNLEISSEVRCIDCSSHNEDLFLVGCSDGTAKLYNLKLVHPVQIFPLAAKGDPVILIQWSPIHPAMFVVLSSSSSLYLWNLLEDLHRPINNYQFSDSRVTWFNFCKSNNSTSHHKPPKLLHMFISREDGETEVHIFKYEISVHEYSKQLEFMKSL